MNFKVVSKNQELIQKATHFLNSLDMSAAIHIQEVDFWLIDVKTIDKTAITSYKNRINSAFLLFIVNDDEDIRICLQNGFTYYIQESFTLSEISSWHKFFLTQHKEDKLILNEHCYIDFLHKQIFIHHKPVNISLQELSLLKALQHGEYVTTKVLCTLLGQNSETSVRTVINRIRKKTYKEFISQKRDFGYRLNLIKVHDESLNISDTYIKELEEENALIQQIVDSSPILIATFVHRQLYCINKSFRDFLGTDIVTELWNEAHGDFFQLIEHASFDSDKLKTQLFTQKGKSQVKIFDFKGTGSNTFEVQTYYFENLDKHLLIFTPLSS